MQAEYLRNGFPIQLWEVHTTLYAKGSGKKQLDDHEQDGLT